MRYKLFIYENRYKLILILCGVLISVIIVGLIVYTNSFKSIEDVNVDTDILLENTDFFENEEVIIEPEPIAQNDIINCFKAKIIEIIDKSSTIIYKVHIGQEENIIESTVIANMNTKFFNLDTKAHIYPSDLVEGMNIVIYASGNYNIGNMNAYLICYGNDTSYSYAQVLDSIKISSDNSYIFNIYGVGDRLRITQDTKLYSSITGGELYNVEEVFKNSIVLYTFEPDYDITDQGNLYTCKEFIVVNFAQYTAED